MEPPRPGRWDYLTAGSVLCLLFVAYVVYPDPIFQYGVWLVVFTLWMAWFVFFGVRWVYRDAGAGE